MFLLSFSSYILIDHSFILNDKRQISDKKAGTLFGIPALSVNRHLVEAGTIAPGRELDHLFVNEALFVLRDVKFHLDTPLCFFQSNLLYTVLFSILRGTYSIKFTEYFRKVAGASKPDREGNIRNCPVALPQKFQAFSQTIAIEICI